MPPLDSFQYGVGRQVVNPDTEDTFTVRGRINTGDGAFLILAPDGVDFGVLVPESHVRDGWNAVARDTDAAALGQVTSQANPAVQTATDQRLDRLESLLISVLERDRTAPAQDVPDAPPTPVPTTDVVPPQPAPPAPDDDTAPPAPAPPAGTDATDGTVSPSPVEAPNPGTPITAPGPAAPSVAPPGAPIPGAEPTTPPVNQ